MKIAPVGMRQQIGNLANLPRAELAERWLALYGCPPPKGISSFFWSGHWPGTFRPRRLAALTAERFASSKKQAQEPSRTIATIGEDETTGLPWQSKHAWWCKSGGWSQSPAELNTSPPSPVPVPDLWW
jgi:hypothetical protein